MAESLHDDGYERVCGLETLKTEGRKKVTVKERAVVLFYVSGVVYALDQFCYREH